MYELQLDLNDFERRANDLQASSDQIPFALSTLLNRALFDARQVLVQSTWPDHVKVYNPTFLTAALRVEPSSKHDLTGSIVDVLGRAHLEAHAKGGTKQPAKSHLAIPVAGAVTRGTHGIVPSQRPRALIVNATVPKRTKTGKVRWRAPGGIIVTDKAIFRMRNGVVQRLYVLASKATINADVPFVEDFETTVRETMRTGLADAIAHAMRTARH